VWYLLLLFFFFATCPPIPERVRPPASSLVFVPLPLSSLLVSGLFPPKHLFVSWFPLTVDGRLKLAYSALHCFANCTLTFLM